MAMTEWEAKYQALAAGITDPAMIENAERLVAAAINLATTSRFTLQEVFWMLLDAIHLQQPTLPVYLTEQITNLSGSSTVRRGYGGGESWRRRRREVPRG